MSYVIILGDVHIGKSVNIGKIGIGTSLNSRIVDQLNLLDWTLDQAIDKNVDDIIITGDIFEDPKPHPSLITLFVSWLKKCQIHNVNVHIVVGNHDMLRSGATIYSSLDIINEVELENVNIYKQTDTIIIGSSAFTLMPYRDRKTLACNSNTEAVALLRESLTYELASIPSTYHKILIGHLSIEGAIPVGDEIDDLSDVLFCPFDMFNGYQYVWMGHVHKPQVLRKKPLLAHIGSMDISNFLESDQKKHIVILDCLSGKFDIEYLPTRPLRKVSLVVPKNTKDTTAYILSELQKINTEFDKAIVRIEISLSSPTLKSASKSAIEKFLIAQGAFNIAGISESKKVELIKKSANNGSNAVIDTKMDIVSAIKTYAQTYIEEAQRSAFIDTCLQIYTRYKSETKE